MEEKFVDKEIDGVKNINIEKLAKLFPSVVKDGQVDFEELKNELGDFEEVAEEKYEFSWVGKQNAKQEAQSGISGMTLKYYPEESKNADTTENLYIEGDNLKVLKLLRNNYANKIKMIYIDPPYNTGNDSFIYPDNYKTNKDIITEQLGITSDGDRNVNINKDNWYKNTKDSSMYHSAWLSMIYTRLKIAWELLTDDGVIFISIDDNEHENLKKVCDEIFGERNFIANICHKNRDGVSNDKIISSNHNFILFYAKNYDIVHEKRNEYGILRTDEDFKNYNKNDNDGNGEYTLNPVTGPGGAMKGNPYYEIMGVTNYWRFSKERVEKMIQEGKIVKIGNTIYQKTYKKDMLGKKKGATTWWDSVGTTAQGTADLKSLFGYAVFDYSKPVSLIEYILNYCEDDKNAILLDFFSGSSTTAESVMKVNSKDNGCRKYIMIQIPESCDERTEAYKKGYKDICEIAQDRIKKAGEKIKEETNADIDYGFKVFKLDETNINWEKQEFKDRIDNYLLLRTDEEKEELLKDFVDGAKDIDIVYELMLRYYGMPLSAKITKLDNIGDRTYSIGDIIIVCLEDEITNETIDKLSNIDFAKLYLRDSSFKGEKSLEIKENLMIRLNLQKDYKDEKSYRVEFI